MLQRMDVLGGAERPVDAPPNALRNHGARVLVLLGAGASLVPAVSSGVALVLGIALALTVGNPWPDRTRRFGHGLLAWSLVGLGAGTDLALVSRIGLAGAGYTLVGIAASLALGAWLGRRLGVARDAALLVSVGTAICGGSAIAAVSPVVRASSRDVSVSLVLVFTLNAVALFVFPAIGHALGLAPSQFGLWCALAIHDTSSVVAAAAHYGGDALQVATAAKLARALWIVPVTFVVAARVARASVASVGEGRASASSSVAAATQARKPWFILGFLLAAAVVTWVPPLASAGHVVAGLARRVLSLTLYAMGLGLSREAVREVGLRAVALAVVLWVTLATATLACIEMGVVR